jgi:putative cell wall-binding protein
MRQIEKKKNTSNLIKAGVFFVAILAISYLVITYINSSYTFIKIKINPEFSLAVNSAGVVEDFIPLNDDAKKTYNASMFKGKSVANAMEIVVNVAKNSNYLTTEKYLKITVISDNKKNIATYETKAVKGLKQADSSLHTELLTANSKEVSIYKRINKLNISNAAVIINKMEVQTGLKASSNNNNGSNSASSNTTTGNSNTTSGSALAPPIAYDPNDAPDYQVGTTLSINNTNVAYKNLSGSNRYETAVAISNTLFPYGSAAVVIANSSALVDGYVGSTLASATNSPILLTDTDSIPDSILNEIRRLSVNKIYILGGTPTISTNVENTLKNKFGVPVERIYGENRYQTATAVAAKVNTMKTVTSVVIAPPTDEAVDSALISSIAGKKNMPILYSQTTYLNDHTKTYLANSSSINTVYMAGNSYSSTVIDAIKALGKNVIVVGGANRYETNNEMIRTFNPSFNEVVVASNFVDMMAASQFTSQRNAVVLYSPSKLTDVQSRFITNNKITKIYYVGGTQNKADYRDLMYKATSTNASKVEDMLFNKGNAVFYISHQGDETIFFGQAITRAINALGKEHVYVVLMTDGSASTVAQAADVKKELQEYKVAFSAVRDNEYVAALQQLGVTNIQIVSSLNFVSQTRFTDGTLSANIDKIKNVMKAFDKKFDGDITHITYSPTYESHEDNKALGTALTQLYYDSSLDNNSFSSSYLLINTIDTNYNSNSTSSLTITDNSNATKIAKAIKSYSKVDTSTQYIRLGLSRRSEPNYYDAVGYKANNRTMTTSLYMPIAQ